ncbi:hypothetical protein EON66_11785, partial [archaeon]
MAAHSIKLCRTILCSRCGALLPSPHHNAGYYGTPVSRTCSTSGSSYYWSGSDIVCTACYRPDPPAGVVATYVSAQEYTYSCAPGTYGASTTRVCSTTGTNLWSGAMPVCTACGAGYYCPGGNTRVQCPGGTYGSVTGATSASCSG